MICISVIGFVHLTVAVILVSLQSHGSKYLSLKTANACFFLTLTLSENCCQLLADLQNLESGENRKSFI